MTLQDLKSEFRLASDGDSWGSVMEWWFGVAGEMYERGLDIPDDWRYRPSPFGGVDPDSYVAPILAEADDNDLARFGAILNRYAGVLKAKGKDY